MQTPANVRNLLLFCLPGIGDTLLAAPAYWHLRSAFPDAHIAALTMIPGTRDILQRLTCIDEIIYFDFLREGVRRSLRFALQLRRRAFDVTFLSYPANRLEYNVLARIVGSPVRLGHWYKHFDRVCGNWLNTHTLHEDGNLTNTEENLRLAGILSGHTSFNSNPQFQLSGDETRFADHWLEKNGLAGRFLIGMHAGGSTAKNHLHKRWPPGAFIACSRHLLDAADATLMIFGGPEEEELKQHISAALGPRVIPVSTNSLLETCALIARCHHFVANDSALMHLATALGVPTTAIFGPTNPQWVRMAAGKRWEVTAGLDCQPCFYYSPKHLACRSGDFRCLRDLDPGRVATQIINHLHRER